MTARDPDPLNGLRPGGRRSFWLREALASEPSTLTADVAAPPFAGRARADVAILGGGYTGLWTALRIRELEPSARVVILEEDLCGSGPSGRNGGFVTGWWDELPGLIRQFGESEAIRTVRALDEAIASLGPWCAAHAVDAGLVEAGFLQVSAAPAQDDAWLESTDQSLQRIFHNFQLLIHYQSQRQEILGRRMVAFAMPAFHSFDQP